MSRRWIYSGFSPYSVYGVGDLHTPGTAWNAGMGGVGIAARSKRFVNILNPASVTSRDSLSSLVVLANAPTDSIVFTVQADWKLQGTRNSWIKPAVAQGHSGRQCINLAIEPNLTHSARYDTLFLSTMGANSSTGKFIVDTIPFVQRAAQ